MLCFGECAKNRYPSKTYAFSSKDQQMFDVISKPTKIEMILVMDIVQLKSVYTQQ